MSITNELIFPVYQFRVLSVRIDHLPARLQLFNIYILNSFVECPYHKQFLVIFKFHLNNLPSECCFDYGYRDIRVFRLCCVHCGYLHVE